MLTAVALTLAIAAPPTTVFHSTAEMLFVVWSGALTKADGNRCAFEPSCSAFARQAIRREGIGGLFLTTDRLMREASAPNYPEAPTKPFRLDPIPAHPPARHLLSGGWCRAQRRRGADRCL